MIPVTTARLRRAIKRRHGNRVAIGRDLGIHRTTVAALIIACGLVDFARQIAGESRTSRKLVEGDAKVTQRARVLEALVLGTRPEAARVLGCSVPTLYRRILQHEITNEEIAQAREQCGAP